MDKRWIALGGAGLGEVGQRFSGTCEAGENRRANEESWLGAKSLKHFVQVDLYSIGAANQRSQHKN